MQRPPCCLTAAIAGGVGEWKTAIILALDQVTPANQFGTDRGAIHAWADVLQSTVVFSVPKDMHRRSAKSA